MNQNKNWPTQAHGANQPRGQQAAQPHPHGPGAVRQKAAAAPQTRARPATPPAYRPPSGPKTVQPKMAHPARQDRTPPAAPPVYRPQPARRTLQAKTAGGESAHATRPPRQPAAPPAYRPQVTPKVLQTKKTESQLAQPVAGAGRRLPNHDLTRAVQRRAAPARNPFGSGKPAGPGNVSGVVQRYPTLDDSGRKDAMIYCISTNDLTEIIYVGQTTDARAGDRFLEHVKNDAWAPWWVHKPNVYGDDESKWPYRVRTLEALKNVTKFETTAAEQWWLEKYLKEGKKLLNDATACSLDCFQKRSVDSDLYDPKNIGVAASWKPSMKAK